MRINFCERDSMKKIFSEFLPIFCHLKNWNKFEWNLHIYLPRDRTNLPPVAPADRTRRRPLACEADRPSWDRLLKIAPPGPGSCGSSGVAHPDAARFRPATSPMTIRCAATSGSGAAPRKCWHRWNRSTISSNPVDQSNSRELNFEIFGGKHVKFKFKIF